MDHLEMHSETYRSICFITGGEEKRLMEKFRNGVFHFMHRTLEEEVSKVNIGSTAIVSTAAQEQKLYRYDDRVFQQCVEVRGNANVKSKQSV